MKENVIDKDTIEKLDETLDNGEEASLDEEEVFDYDLNEIYEWLITDIKEAAIHCGMGSPKWVTFSDIADQLLFLAIKDLYDNEEGDFKRSSYAHARDKAINEVSDEAVKLLAKKDEFDKAIDKNKKEYKRAGQYAQYYRDKVIEAFKKVGLNIDEIEPIIMAKSSDFKFTDDNATELTNISNLKIIKKIANKSICSSKKVSNSEFRELFKEYYSLPWPIRIKDKEGIYIIENGKQIEIPDDSYYTIIQYAIRRFELESHFLIDWMNQIADYAVEHSHSMPSQSRIWLFCLPLPQRIIRDNRPVMLRSKLVASLFESTDDDFNNLVEEYKFAYSYISFELFDQGHDRKMKLVDKIKGVSYYDRASFIIEHYNLWNNWKHDKNADLKELYPDEKIRFMRDFIDRTFDDVKPPTSEIYR